MCSYAQLSNSVRVFGALCDSNFGFTVVDGIAILTVHRRCAPTTKQYAHFPSSK